MGVDARMYVQHSGVLTDLEVRQLAGKLHSVVGGAVWVWRPEEDSFYKDGKHAIQIYVPDSYEIDDLSEGHFALNGLQTLEVSMAGRYYGPGYERGDWPAIKSVAEFFDHNLTDAVVYYGGDSGGLEDLEPLDAAARAEMDKHFYNVGHDPYQMYFGSNEPGRPTCDFCGGRPFVHSGGGGGDTFYHCSGCGEQRIVGQGKTYVLKKGEDFFTARRNM